MARIRSIHPDACRSRKLAAVTAEAERVYWRLQPQCDDDGRVEDEPDVLASLMFQVQREITAEMVDEWLWELAEGELLDRYEAGGVAYLEVRKWSTYQHPQRKKDSAIPPAQGRGSRTRTRHVRDGDASCTAHVPSGVEKEWSGVGAEGESEGEVYGFAARAASAPQRLQPGWTDPIAITGGSTA